MKKAIFAIGLVVSLASCGGSTTTQNDSTSDSATVISTDTSVGTVVDSVKVDSVKVDSAKTVK
jgi:hypothetical protein